MSRIINLFLFILIVFFIFVALIKIVTGSTWKDAFGILGILCEEMKEASPHRCSGNPEA